MKHSDFELLSKSELNPIKCPRFKEVTKKKAKKSLCVLFSSQQEIGSKSQMRAKRAPGGIWTWVSFQLKTRLCVSQQRGRGLLREHTLVYLRQSWQTRPETLGGMGGDACHTNYLVLQSPSLPAKQKWIPSQL